MCGLCKKELSSASRVGEKEEEEREDDEKGRSRCKFNRDCDLIRMRAGLIFR